MKNIQSQVSRNALWAIAQTIVSAGVLFFLYRFLLSELGAEKLGLWSLILASTSLARIGELGFSNATLRFVGKYVGMGKLDDASEILETSLITIGFPMAIILASVIPILGLVLPWVVPLQHMPDALVIVPWAMLALWFGIIGGLVQSAIDGTGRMDQRNMILIASTLIYILTALILTSMFGLQGVAIAQAVQAGVTLFAMWMLAKAQLKSLPIFPYRWRKQRFLEIFAFALNMQLGSIVGMFIEPITKALISKFGGLSFLAYYEMASQVISRARSVLIAGFQAMAPQFAIASGRESHMKLFIESLEKATNPGIPYMAIVMSSLPIISHIWIGRFENAFVFTAELLCVTWTLVTLMMPAYFLLVGAGSAKPIALAHSATTILTLLMGLIGGFLAGGYGVILGWSVALISANFYLVYEANKYLYQKGEKHEINIFGLMRLTFTAMCLLIAFSSGLVKYFVMEDVILSLFMPFALSTALIYTISRLAKRYRII
jgi:O-antigen/teichoic acid export membrane protein